jgi:hypothetical protein
MRLSLHSANGERKRGPERGQRLERDYAPENVASGKRRDDPVTTYAEAGGLFAWFYSVRYFERPGDATHRKAATIRVGCAITRAAKSAYSPAVTVLAPWKHGPSMRQRIQPKGLARPRFPSVEMLDLVAHLHVGCKRGCTGPRRRAADNARINRGRRSRKWLSKAAGAGFSWEQAR